MKAGCLLWKSFRAGPGLFALLFVSACSPLQNLCSNKPWLHCGDRIEVHKDYVYLDDPAFLYHHKTVATTRDGIYSFRLGLFFNPYRFKTAQVKAEIHPYQKPIFVDTMASHIFLAGGTGTVPCRLDSTYFVSANNKKERMTLQFFCQDYQPQWGREDTLTLRFNTGKGSEDSTAVLALPFTTSFHGPIYSFAIGATLLLSLTAIGELLTAGK